MKTKNEKFHGKMTGKEKCAVCERSCFLKYAGNGQWLCSEHRKVVKSKKHLFLDELGARFDKMVGRTD